MVAVGNKRLATIAALDYFSNQIADKGFDHPSHWFVIVHD
jgi:hypothetical protein